jgi:hypothetical protein
MIFAQIGKISGSIDTVIVPRADGSNIEEQIEEAKVLAMERCVAAGGSRATLEVIEIELIPISYVTDGATRLIVRAVADLSEAPEDVQTFEVPLYERCDEVDSLESYTKRDDSDATSYDIVQNLDLEIYRPRLVGDLWYLSQIDLQFLQDGAGVLGVGSCGDPYPSYVACLGALGKGEKITIKKQDSISEDAVVLVAGFMVSPARDLFLSVADSTNRALPLSISNEFLARMSRGPAMASLRPC